MRTLPPNGYGLYGMCGGVSEWTCDFYDALRYDPRRPPPPPFAANAPRVLRGGSFTDDAEAVTVSFRAALADERGGASPTVGFRLVRRSPPSATPVAEVLPAAAPTPPRTVSPRPWWRRLFSR